MTPYPYIKAGDLKNGTVLKNRIRYLSEETHREFEMDIRLVPTRSFT